MAVPNFFVSDNFEINLGKYSSKLIRISFSRIILVSSDVEDRQHAFQKRLKSRILYITRGHIDIITSSLSC